MTRQYTTFSFGVKLLATTLGFTLRVGYAPLV